MNPSQSLLGGLNRRSVGARVLITASLSFLVIAFCAFRIWTNLRLLEQTQTWVAHTEEVVSTTNRAMSALVDMETGVRGFAVGGDTRFLEPLETGRRNFQSEITAALELVSDNPAQVARFNKLAELEDSWISGPAEQDLAGRRAVAAGQLTEAAYVEAFNRAAGKQLMDQMRAQVAEIITEEQSLLGLRDQNYRAAVADSRLWGSWIIGLAIVAGWGALFYISRDVQNVLGRVSAHLNDTSDQVAAAAGEVANASQLLAQGASEQAASLEETSASLEEINGQAKRNGESAENARALAHEARAATENGTTQMREMVAAMDDIKVASTNIAKIVKTIDEIAFQTNILALNAAVEAARAGEAGAGFAVVADEVRSLAQRAALAARETTESIDDSIRKSSRGAELSGRVAEGLEHIAGTARKVADLVVEIAASSREQGQGIAQVGTAVTQMDKVTQSNASNAEETAAAAQQLESQSAALKDAVGELLSLVGGRSRATTYAGPIQSPRVSTTTPHRLPPLTPALPIRKALT